MNAFSELELLSLALVALVLLILSLVGLCAVVLRHMERQEAHLARMAAGQLLLTADHAKRHKQPRRK